MRSSNFVGVLIEDKFLQSDTITKNNPLHRVGNFCTEAYGRMIAKFLWEFINHPRSKPTKNQIKQIK